MTYGSPDFLMRSDVLRCLFPESISEQDAAVSAPGLNQSQGGMCIFWVLRVGVGVAQQGVGP